MLATTILGVSQYARLWRSVWWAQHLVMLLALVVGSVLLGASALYLAGGLETLANAWIRDTMGQGLDAAKQEDALMNIAAFYWIARGVARDAPATVASLVAASALVIATYVLGCRAFRLRLLIVHLVALAALTIVLWIAVAQMARAGVHPPEYDPAGGRVERFADQMLATMCVLVLLPALVLLTGPFVAIGKPGERLPQIGAHRLYVGDADWQQVVTSYITRAEPIILIAGKTTWVQWELSNIAALGRLNRLLIVFPRSTNAERAARWENLKPALAGTPWSAAADAIDIAGALAIFVQSEGFAVVKSRAAHESDYEAALRVATFLIGRGRV